MMEFYPFRDRQVAHGQLVLAYRTSMELGAHWGVMAMEGANRGLVIGHAPRVSLEAVEVLGVERAVKVVRGTAVVGVGVVGLYCAYGTYGCATEVKLDEGVLKAGFADLTDGGRVLVKDIQVPA